MQYDFHGWATKNDLRCSDGRTIRHGAFKECDGKTVPLVWQHRHDDPSNVLGHALLENRDEGVYVYGSFNNGEKAKDAKEAIAHGDIVALSIYANNLQQKGGDVLHGVIREVSLVLAGANPGAFIESPRLAHSDEFAEDEATIYSGELLHTDEPAEEASKEEPSESTASDETIEHADEKKDEDYHKEALAEYEKMTDAQKEAVQYLIGAVISTEKKDEKKEEAKHSDTNEEENSMKNNVFDNTTPSQSPVISHADQLDIITTAKKVGSFKAVLEAYCEDHALAHGDVTPKAVSGFAADNIGNLFPEYKDVRGGAPELVTDDNAWVEAILRKTRKSPFSRIRTSQVDIRNIEALRAKGYVKGTEKTIVGNYAYAKRETDAQTIYVKSALNRDDVVDITDFDYIGYQYKIDQLQLREELATAMLLGDGREDGVDGKIEPTHIRPVYGDAALYTIYKNMTPFMEAINGDFSDNFGESYKYAEGAIAALLDAKIDYRGTGTLDMFCTQQFFNKMLLAKDLNGRRIYNNKSELASALGVNEIYPVSKMAGKTRESGGKTYALNAIFVNWGDYNIGSTKGGEITHFTQFDIDFNQHKSLLETRLSGANTRIMSVIVLEEETNPN